MVEISNPSQDLLGLSNKEKIASLREFTVSPEGQEKMTTFVDNLRSEIGHDNGWESVCRQAETELDQYPVTEAVLNRLNSAFSAFIDQMPPGHDRGHLSRDLLASLYLYHSTKNNIKYQSDAAAGLFAGIYHDIGTAIIPRYKDNQFGAGHAETSSYLFWQVSEGLIGKNTRKLVCYAIAAHTHYLNDIHTNTPPSYTRQVYWDNLRQDDDGKLIGAAVHLARRSDRTDTNGVNLIFRHINAHMDALQSGGQEFHGDQWVDINRDSLVKVLTPIIRDNPAKPLTTLEHVSNFAKSNNGQTPYSEKDYLFPHFRKILGLELSQFSEFVASINSHYLTVPSDESEEQEVFKDFLYKVSKSNPEHFQQSWSNFEKIWPDISQDDKQRWYKGLLYAKTAYNDILDFYQTELKSSEFFHLAESTIDFLRH
jgi:hypothetical protein